MAKSQKQGRKKNRKHGRNRAKCERYAREHGAHAAGPGEDPGNRPPQGVDVAWQQQVAPRSRPGAPGPARCFRGGVMNDKPKCRDCGTREVDHPGGLCGTCQRIRDNVRAAVEQKKRRQGNGQGGGKGKKK